MTADIIFIFNLTTAALPNINLKAFGVRALSCDDGDDVASIARGFSKQVLLVYSVVEPLEDWEPIKFWARA